MSVLHLNRTIQGAPGTFRPGEIYFYKQYVPVEPEAPLSPIVLKIAAWTLTFVSHSAHLRR